MPSLRDIQRAFADALLTGGGEAACVALVPARDVAARMDVYRRALFANYRGALAASYPVVRQLVGAAFFDAAVDAFVHTHPSRSGDLNVYGDAFPRFVESYAPASALPYLGDVARLEWAQDEAQRAADTAMTPEEVLAAMARVPGEALVTTRVALAPSCRFVRSRYPVLRIWRAHQREADTDMHIAFDGPPDALLVRRDDNGIAIERLPPGLDAWLRALARGDTLGSALDAAIDADPAFDVGGAIATRIADGTLAGVRM